MKSNVVIHSPDRNLFGVVIRQETKTGFLNLSDLQEAYTVLRVKSGLPHKGEFQHILSQKENADRVFFILKKRGVINCEYSHFIDMVDTESLIKVLKKLGVYKTTGGRENKSSWCSPDIFILTAIELSPALYAEVIIWATDNLILNRIEAGNFYKGLSKAISKFVSIDYAKMAKALNWKVFGRHETGMRNLATKEELKKMYELESKIAFACDMGYIKTFEDCIKEIERCIL